MKIKSKKIVYDTIEVYDISVPIYENFLLENGVFVHNSKMPDGSTGSKDIADAVAGAFINALSNPVRISQVHAIKMATETQQSDYSYFNDISDYNNLVF